MSGIVYYARRANSSACRNYYKSSGIAPYGKTGNGVCIEHAYSDGSGNAASYYWYTSAGGCTENTSGSESFEDTSYVCGTGDAGHDGSGTDAVLMASKP